MPPRRVSEQPSPGPDGAAVTAARLTVAQARSLGVDTAARRVRTTARRAAGPYRTRCVRCGAVFDRQAAEDRHLAATGHGRYDLLTNPPTDPKDS